ncbi:MAG: hypothetical protein ABI988_15560, partial [Nitrospirota bacterium]
MMISRPLLLAACFLLSLQALSAQKQDNVWYFGYKVGIDFNGPSPVVLTDGKMVTQEGCASIADRNTGKLLFYTDGDSVWNRNHGTMLNGYGLYGHYSSTQSALIVPMPGDTTRYFIFTSDAARNKDTEGKGI